MRAYRPLTAIVALVIGLVLAEAMLGCRHKVQVMLPQTVKVGEILKWQGVDKSVGTLILTIPESLCESSAALGNPDKNYPVYVVTVPAEGLECKVQSHSGDSTVPLTYKYRYIPVPRKDASSAAAGQPHVQVLDIVGSCDGCDGRKRDDKDLTLLVDAPSFDGYVELPRTNIPVVNDPYGRQLSNIDKVPSSRANVYWHIDYPNVATITFKSPSPCSSIDGQKSTTVACHITSATATTVYRYTVSVTTPTNTYASNYDYTLTTQ